MEKRKGHKKQVLCIVRYKNIKYIIITCKTHKIHNSYPEMIENFGRLQGECKRKNATFVQCEEE